MESQFGRTARNRAPRFGGSGEIAQSVVGVGNKKTQCVPGKGKALRSRYGVGFILFLDKISDATV